MGRKFGWRSGVLKCQDAKLEGDLYVQDDIVFSDVSAGVLGVTGGIDMQSTTSAIGIDMGGTFSTTAINIDGTVTTGIIIGDATTGILLDGDFTTAIDINAEAALTDAITINAEAGVTIGTGLNMTTETTGIITTAISLTYTSDCTEGMAMTVATTKTLTTGMSMSGAGTYTTGILLDATAIGTGISITAGSLTDGIKISGTTPVDGVEISSACSGHMINLSGASTGNGLTISGATSDTGIEVSGTCANFAMDISGAQTAVGLSIAGTCGTHAISISGAQTGAGITISNTCGTYGLNISADATTGINIAAQGTMGIALAVAAAVGGIAIDAGTVNHAADGSIVDINLDIEGAYSVNAMNVNLDFETTGMAGTDISTTFNADINELLVHTDGAGLYGTSITLTGFATGRCDLIGHLVTLDGSKTAGDTSTGFKAISTQTINHSGEALYGNWINFSGITHTDGDIYGQYLDMSFANGSTSYGIYMNMGTASTAGISINGTSVIGIDIATGCTTGMLITAATGYAIDIVTSGQFRMGIQGTGIPTVTATPFAVEIHTETGGDIVSGATGLTAGIRSRYEVSIAQTNNISFCAIEGRLRPKANMAEGVHSGVRGTIESDAMIFSGSATTQRNAGTFTLELASGTTVTSGWLTGIAIDSQVDGSISMASCTFVGLRIRAGSSKEVFEHGIYLDADSAATGITLGNVTGTGIDIGTSAHAINIGTPTTGIFKIVSDDTIVSDANQAILVDISGTANAGFIKVILDSSTAKYIALYDTKTS